jgi:AcrR family transcriptional regulator
MAKDSRFRLVQSAAKLIALRGVNGTSFSDVLADSCGPRGSLYHHFPGGKNEMAIDAIAFTSEQILTHQRAFPGGTPADVLAWFVAIFRHAVHASGGRCGCAVAGVALDTGEPGLLLEAARTAFSTWTAVLAEQFEQSGLPTARAQALATTTLAAMEGALILCRAARDTAPLETVANELRLLA